MPSLRRSSKEAERRRSLLISKPLLRKRQSITSIDSLKTFLSRRRSTRASLRHSIEPTTINVIREALLGKFEENASLFDVRDAARLRADDWLIARFLLDKLPDFSSQLEAIEPTIAALEETLKWRREFGVNDLKDSDFPVQFYQSGVVTVARENRIIYIRARRYKRVSGWTDVISKWIIHEIEKMEHRAPGERVSIILDNADVGMSAIDTSLGLTLIPILLRHYPSGFDNFTLLDMPWVCRATTAICLKLLPARLQGLIKIMDSKQAINVYGSGSLPTFMGGDVEFSLETPAEALDIEEVGKKNNIDESSIKKLKSHLSSLPPLNC